VLPLEGDGQHLRESVERAFQHIQQALSGESEDCLGLKQQWELLAEEEEKASWVSCYLSPAEDMDLASQACQHLSTRFVELNADFRMLRHRILCPSLNKHAQWIWRSFIYKLAAHYKDKMTGFILEARKLAEEQRLAEQNTLETQTYYHRHIGRKSRARAKEFDLYKEEASGVLTLLQQVLNYADEVLPGPKLRTATLQETAAWAKNNKQRLARPARSKPGVVHVTDKKKVE
jgi:hypothetical protein